LRRFDRKPVMTCALTSGGTRQAREPAWMLALEAAPVVSLRGIA